ncbi:carboxypeptidase C PRC1 [Ascoidea rubescens DSM 1968]|uniref:Carboxypeptidase n=1 Tax=Ascoidea rubescens DSM 1968 TaxID=1344418 RepID=A0A1D2VDN0_9ASCO|nr:carboxypeptidase Y precursor [Ascoidea rubescens DSM 1968]ODV59709.1 carboxypeptidase Y precursor [Ascoidea rubescens DSM 1968]
MRRPTSLGLDGIASSSSYITDEIRSIWSSLEKDHPFLLSNLQFKTSSKAKIVKDFKSNYESTHSFVDHNDPTLSNYNLRINSNGPLSLGVDTVKQYSGYLDVQDEDKHFFYWFFESRNDPKNDPIVLWLNGGPGCSSLTGLFFELGSSSIDAKLQPVSNPFSWNNNASVIFLDQPVNVGYSYSSNSVSSTIAASKDVLAFLKLFFNKFPQYSHLDFHIAGESYAGHYIPIFASDILDQQLAPNSNLNFNLKSVLIGNGLTDPLTQYKYYEPMACGEGGEPSVLTPDECDQMLQSEPRCLSLIESCYNSQSVWSCVPASIYCNNQAFSAYQRTGKNVYDMRKDCEGNLCYKDLKNIDNYLNQDFVKNAVGADVDYYESCNMDINRNFLFNGDWMKPYHNAVTKLLNQNLPVLIYAGDKDFICNWLGNNAWSNDLPYKHHTQYSAKSLQKFITNDGEEAGEFKNYKNFTFLRLFNGGHMVPYDQPNSSLDMFNRWISGDYSFGDY